MQILKRMVFVLLLMVYAVVCLIVACCLTGYFGVALLSLLGAAFGRYDLFAQGAVMIFISLPVIVLCEKLEKPFDSLTSDLYNTLDNWSKR